MELQVNGNYRCKDRVFKVVAIKPDETLTTIKYRDGLVMDLPTDLLEAVCSPVAVSVK